MAERQEITVRAELRAGRGKNDSRRLRARGMVPLTIYGGEGEPVAAAAPLAELAAILRSGAGHNAIFTLDVDGVGPSEVMFLDRQIDPVKTRLIHADLRRLVRGQEVEVSVRLELEGEPAGTTDGEGITIVTDPETAVATVAVVREEQVEERTPEEEVSEPEVIGKGKKEDEE